MVRRKFGLFSEEDQGDSPHPQLPDTAMMAAEGCDGWVQPDWRDTRNRGNGGNKNVKSHTLSRGQRRKVPFKINSSGRVEDQLNLGQWPWYPGPHPVPVCSPSPP